MSGCISTDLTAPDGTKLNRVALFTNIGTIHARSARNANGTYTIAIDEEQVDQTTAMANALAAMAEALKAKP